MKTFLLELLRIWPSDDFTIGHLSFDGMPECFTLEDEYREVKIPGETRIPAGRYPVKLRLVESPLTMKYRKNFPWFDYHLQIMDVPNFNYVYIHIGNTDEHTDACVLVGETADKEGFIGRSTKAYKELYLKIRPLLDETDSEIWIDIFDFVKGYN